MYPFVRLAKEMFKFRNASNLGAFDTHVSHHICWPWDIDLWVELNNGRTLTLYDLGRLPLAKRVGLMKVVQDNKWGLTVAGVSVRYRRRVRPFSKIEIRSRAIALDDRFMYLEQSMWTKSGECANHILLRMAVTDASGIVQPAKAMAQLPDAVTTTEMPDWVKNWIEADATRPWPPMQDAK